MRHWSFYDSATGRLIGSSGAFKDEAMMRANLPEGMAAIEGRYDHLSQRVDLNTAAIVDYQPPQPSDEHEWDDEAKRWALSRVGRERIRLLAEIQEAEKLSGPRAVREALLAVLPDGPERKRLADIDATIAEARADLITVAALPARKDI